LRQLSRDRYGKLERVMPELRHAPDHHGTRNAAGQQGNGPNSAVSSAIDHGCAITNLAKAGDPTVAERDDLRPVMFILTADPGR
jgi:hypothetical protein